MPRPRALSISFFALALTAASPALAVTAEELWAEWQAQSAAMGQVMAAAEVVAGNGTLTLRGFSNTYSDGEVSTVGRLDEIVMTENADGTVAIDMSDVYAITISFSVGDNVPPANIGLNMIAPDLAMTASGDVGARVYDYSAPSIIIEEGEISGGGSAPPTMDIMIAAQDVAATYQLDGTDPENLGFASSSTTGGITGAFDILPPPGEEGRMKIAFALGAIDASSAGRLGNLAELAENPEVVPAGFDLTGDVTYASAQLDLTFEHPEDAFNLFASNRGGSMAVRFSEAEIDYRVTAEGSTTHFASPEMPIPVDFSVGSAEIAFRIPLRAEPDPQPVTARLAYQGVTIGPEAWAMVDPMQAFPRDPISVIADLSGNVQILTSLFGMDPSTMTGPPGELRDMTLNELQISVGGASLTGTGSATFAPGPVPMPVGSVDLQLSGGNALLDTLQGMGIVPIEQLAMARGLLGAFARPGATPDTLESTIEFTEGGNIIANGVPLP